jgi:hypothetical protein
VKAGAEIGDVAAGSTSEEGISCRGGSVNVGSTLLPCPKVILPLELELFANTLSTVAELAFGKRLRSACVAFDWRSSTARMRAARTRAPRTPVASHAVSRLKLLITSPVNGYFLVLGSFSTWAWLLHSGNTLRKRVRAHIKLLVVPASVEDHDARSYFGLFLDRLGHNRRGGEEMGLKA